MGTGYQRDSKFWVPMGTGQKKFFGTDGYRPEKFFEYRCVPARKIFLGTDVPDRRFFLKVSDFGNRTPPRRLEISTQTLLENIAKVRGYCLGEVSKVSANGNFSKKIIL